MCKSMMYMSESKCGRYRKQKRYVGNAKTTVRGYYNRVISGDEVSLVSR